MSCNTVSEFKIRVRLIITTSMKDSDSGASESAAARVKSRVRRPLVEELQRNLNTLTPRRRVRAGTSTIRYPRPRILRPGSTTASSTAMTPYGRRHFRKRPSSTRSEWRRIRGRSRRSTRPCTFGPRRGIRRRRPAAERPRCIYTNPRSRPHNCPWCSTSDNCRRSLCSTPGGCCSR